MDGRANDSISSVETKPDQGQFLKESKTHKFYIEK